MDTVGLQSESEIYAVVDNNTAPMFSGIRNGEAGVVEEYACGQVFLTKLDQGSAAFYQPANLFGMR
jgi:hypothetical protein